MSVIYCLQALDHAVCFVKVDNNTWVFLPFLIECRLHIYIFFYNIKAKIYTNTQKDKALKLIVMLTVGYFLSQEKESLREHCLYEMAVHPIYQSQEKLQSSNPSADILT